MALFGISDTEFGIKEMANQLFCSNRPIYSIGIGMIVAVDPYSHVYTVSAYPTLQSVPPIPAVPLGVRGNIRRGVQLQGGYYVGDMVLYLRQTNYGANAVAELAYILGSITTKFIEVNKVPDLVSGSRWDGDNLDSGLIALFNNLMTRNQANTKPKWATGHGGIDMLPGAYEAAGKLVSLLVDDYFAGIRATCAEFLVSGIDRRLISRSMLRTVSTVNSIEDIAILNTSTITTKKSCGNVNEAWYDCVEEGDANISESTERGPDGELPTAVYRDITQSGDVLYGSHRTILDEKEESALYTDFLGMDGTRKMLSASRVIIGKRPGLKSFQYIGQRLNVEDQSDAEQDTADLDTPVKLSTGDKRNWKVTENDALFALNGYPTEFLDFSKGEYPDDGEIVEIPDSARKDKAIPIKEGSCYIEFQDDGGIKLVDGWGSFILLSHGNVEIHATNNIITTAARDELHFAGHNITNYATSDVALQAYKGTFRIEGGKDLLLHGATEDPKGKVVLESAQDLKILALNIAQTSLNVSIDCRNPQKPSITGGTFQVLAKDGKINFSGDVIRENATAICLTSDTKAIILSGTITIAGDIMLNGGIRSRQKNTLITVVTASGANSRKTFASGTQGQWINGIGGLKLNNDCYINGQCIASGPVVGEYVFTLQRQKELQKASNSDALRALTKPYSGTGPNTDFAINAKDLLPGGSKELKELGFSFGESDVSCVYRVVAPSPKGGTWQNKGLKNLEPGVSYIYPGIKFWTGNSVKDVSVRNKEQTYPFNNLSIATQN